MTCCANWMTMLCAKVTCSNVRRSIPRSDDLGANPSERPLVVRDPLGWLWCLAARRGRCPPSLRHVRWRSRFSWWFPVTGRHLKVTEHLRPAFVWVWPVATSVRSWWSSSLSGDTRLPSLPNTWSSVMIRRSCAAIRSILNPCRTPRGNFANVAEASSNDCTQVQFIDRVVRVSEIMQRRHPTAHVNQKIVKVSMIQFIDKVLNNPVAPSCQCQVCRMSGRPWRLSQKQFLDKVSTWPLLCNGRCSNFQKVFNSWRKSSESWRWFLSTCFWEACETDGTCSRVSNARRRVIQRYVTAVLRQAVRHHRVHRRSVHHLNRVITWKKTRSQYQRQRISRSTNQRQGTSTETAITTDTQSSSNVIRHHKEIRRGDGMRTYGRTKSRHWT